MLSLYVLCAALGYLLGSFPTGYLVGRSRGIDIREHGSGNIGATNVVRVLGKKLGYGVFICDALKGWLAAVGGNLIAAHGIAALYRSSATLALDAPSAVSHALVLGGIIAALCCILGHNFPVWLKFRGGKGVATTVGVLLGLMPAAIGIAAVLWAVCFFAFRYVSLASLIGAASLPVTVWLITHSPATPAATNPLFWFSLAAMALIFWRHRTNVQRLLNGTEPRFDRRRSESSSPPVP